MNVLLLPRTDTAAQVSERLLGWSKAGLLRPFCIWDAGGPADAPVRRVCGEEIEELPLGDALAGAPPEEIAFVAFYPLAAAEQADAGFAEQVDLFLGWAREEVLDVDLEKPLACAFAVAPAGSDQRVPAELFRANWSNFLVAPEDRSSPGAVNQLQGLNGSSEDRFLRHATHAVATTAAIWSTPDAQRPDLFAQMDAPLGPRKVEVRVMRCFSRVVELGHVADHIAGLVFEPRGGWPRPGTDFERPTDVGRVVGTAARLYLKRHRDVLDRRPFEPILEEPPKQLGLIEAFLALVDQVIQFVRRRPFELIEEAVESVYNRVAERIERLSASTGRIRVKPWDQRADEDGGLAQLGEVIDEDVVVTEDGPVQRTWTELRETTLGLIDGSPLPGEVDKAVIGPSERRAIVSDPERLARDSASQDEGEDDSERPLLQEIRAVVAAAKEAADERAEALAESLEEKDDETESPDPDLKPKRWRAWLRRDSWLLALVRRAFAYWFGALVALVAAWVLLPFPASLVASVAIVVVWFFATASLARHALRRPRLPENPDAIRELGELNRALERAQALGDAKRLERRLSELDAWIAVLTELVHRPWVREPFEGVELVDTIDEEILPTACSVAVARSDEALLDRIAARTRADTFRPGWLSGVYRTVVDMAMREYNLARGDVGPPPDPAADLSGDRDSPRHALLDAVLRGEGRRRFDNPMAGDLLEAIDKMKLDELAPAVVPASHDARPLAPTATWILPPDGVAAVADEHGHRIVGIRGWSATGAIVASGVAVTAAAAVDGVLGVTTADGAAVAVTESTRPPGTDLGLLRLGEDGALEPGLAAQAPRPRKGDGVVALEAAAGGPKVRWGFVVSADGDELAVLYDGGTPGVGAAVFHVDSRQLIAVHGRRGELLPVPDDVETLLAAGSGGPEPIGNGVAGVDEEVRASSFLAAIAEQNGPTALQPGYWARHAVANQIEYLLPPELAGVDVSGPLSSLSGGAAYLRPLRVMIHRIEITHGVEPHELVACS